MLNKKITCIVCPMGCLLELKNVKDELKISGNRCPRGKKYAIEEMTSPSRVVTSTVKVVGGKHPITSIKTNSPIPKDSIFDIMEKISKLEVQAPLNVGDTIYKNILDTKADLVVTRRIERA